MKLHFQTEMTYIQNRWKRQKKIVFFCDCIQPKLIKTSHHRKSKWHKKLLVNLCTHSAFEFPLNFPFTFAKSMQMNGKVENLLTIDDTVCG